MKLAGNYMFTGGYRIRFNLILASYIPAQGTPNKIICVLYGIKKLWLAVK